MSPVSALPHDSANQHISKAESLLESDILKQGRREMLGAAAVGLAASQAQKATALDYNQLQGLTYLQVKGSGIANTCPLMSSGTTNLKDLPAGNYAFSKFCMEPTSFKVKEESQFKGAAAEFVDTKLMTRLTYTLDDISGKLAVMERLHLLKRTALTMHRQPFSCQEVSEF